MAYFNYGEARKYYTDQEIQEFLSQNPELKVMNYTPEPAPTPQSPSQPPDFVSPFANDQVVKTQGIGENPQNYPSTGGHAGEDLAYIRNPEYGTPTTEDEIRAAIGGLVLSGYQPGGYGNVTAIVGANPQELAQMAPEEKQNLVNEFQQYLPTANSLQDFPSLGKYENVALLGHGADTPLPSGSEVATGSAVMREGSSGMSTAPHLHTEYTNKGQLKALMDIIRNRLYR
jgi:murein DD-endopeptidase MepM/ murein hydrolase activator NlpD